MPRVPPNFKVTHKSLLLWNSAKLAPSYPPVFRSPRSRGPLIQGMPKQSHCRAEILICDLSVSFLIVLDTAIPPSSPISVVYLLIDSQMWLDSFLHTLIPLSYCYTHDLSPAHAHIYTLHHKQCSYTTSKQLRAVKYVLEIYLYPF